MIDNILTVLKRYINKNSLLWIALKKIDVLLVRTFPKRAICSPIRSWRPQWLPRWVKLLNENAYPHTPREHSDLFIAYSGGGTEIEVLNWLYSTVCLLKPKCIVETGAYIGLGTLALAAACKANGFGEVHSIEIDAGFCKKANELLRKERLSGFATVHCVDSLTFLRDTALSFDFAFFDSCIGIRAEEYKICRERHILKRVACFHDTSPTRNLTYIDPGPIDHAEYRRQIYEFSKQAGVTGYFESALSKGIIVLFLGDEQVAHP